MELLEIVAATRVIAVVRAARVADPEALLDAFSSAGVRCVEFTFTIPDVVDVIQATSTDERSMVGAGTVLGARDARRAIDAGARFVVSPTLDVDVARACVDAHIPFILGGFTPTEIVAARRLGASAVKLFPASAAGPRYVRELLGPLTEIPLIPSGGIDESNARSFLEAGAVGVFAGSAVAPAEHVAEGRHDEIARSARTFVASIMGGPP